MHSYAFRIGSRYRIRAFRIGSRYRIRAFRIGSCHRKRAFRIESRYRIRAFRIESRYRIRAFRIARFIPIRAAGQRLFRINDSAVRVPTHSTLPIGSCLAYQQRGGSRPPDPLCRRNIAFQPPSGMRCLCLFRRLGSFCFSAFPCSRGLDVCVPSACPAPINCRYVSLSQADC